MGTSIFTMAKMDKRMDVTAVAAAVMKKFIECVEETAQLHTFLIE